MNIRSFRIIQNALGECGFDPCEQRRTIAWKMEIDGEYYAAWTDLEDEESLRVFAKSILAFLDDPKRFKIHQAATPAKLGGL